MHHSSRWEAYLQNLSDNSDGDISSLDTINYMYQVFNSQKIWFTGGGKSEHQKAAEAHLRRSDALINDCTKQVEALEETLANTPKPSEVLDWRTVFL